MENLAGWAIDAELGFPPLEAMGWQIDSLPWRSEGVDWDLFDAVYIGTPWDYPEDPGRFLQVLDCIDQSAAVLVNDIALVRWTIPKTYLRDLEKEGVAIVPSIWGDTMEEGAIDNAFSQFDVDIEGAPYRHIRTAPYRVWCLEELRRHFDALSESQQREVREKLEAHGCWAPLWQVEEPRSGIDPDRKVPFAGGDSATGMSLKDAEKLNWLPVSAAKRNK